MTNSESASNHQLGALPARDGSPQRDLLVALMASVVASLPVFLVGALAVQIRSSLHFSTSELGFIVTFSYLGAAMWSVPSGLLAERIGGVRVLKFAPLTGGVLLVGLATITTSWVTIGVLLFFSGMVSASIATGSNLFLAKRTDPAHQGLIFGIKQAAIPTASLLGGVAVPAIALTVGWRWAFVGAAVLALLTFLLVPAPATSLSERRAERSATSLPNLRRTPLIVLGIGLGLGVFSATGVAAFLVIDAVRIGIGHGNAGLTVAIASAAAVIGRVITGFLADRRGGRHFPVVATMMGIGALGYLALAVGASTRLHWLYVAGAIFALGVGWGWNGLFNFATIHTHRHAPARATGITQVGGRLGGMLGPLVLGVVATNLSFPAAWVVAGISTGSGAIAVMIGRRLLLRSREEPAPTTLSST